MRNQVQTVVLAVALAHCLTSGASAETLTAAGVISKVTVYRGQALVTRSIDIDLPPGASELTVGNLPSMIVPESIYAETSGSTKVLSVRYRQRAVMEDTRQEVKELDAQIETAKHKLKYATEEHRLNDQQWKMYENLKDFTLAAEKTDLNKGVLAYEPVQNLTDLIEKKGADYLQRKLKLEDDIAESQKELELLERKRNELVAGRSRTEREAILFISGADGKKIHIELSYLVNGANWQQQYNLRANPQQSNVLIEYNAVVNQTSGEDWDGVTLWLSTAEPSLVAAAPTLEAMLVGLSMPAQVQQVADAPMQQFDQIRQFQKSRRDYVKQGVAANVELNAWAVRNQMLFFNVDQREAQEFQQKIAEISRTEGVSVTYQLPGRLTLPSRSDQQLVSIASIAAKARFTLVATPLLTDYVYLQADLLNGSDTVLLPGPASMFRNGEFVGQGQLPQVTIGQTFTAGFGIDSQVRVVRELEDKKTRIQGGNRIDTYDYRIALSNYKNTPVELRLLDRLPYAEDTSIKIELGKTEPPLSQDTEYLRTARKKGILRWDLSLAPSAVEANATLVRYSFTMEYDRNMQIQPRQSTSQQ